MGDTMRKVCAKRGYEMKAPCAFVAGLALALSFEKVGQCQTVEATHDVIL